MDFVKLGPAVRIVLPLKYVYRVTIKSVGLCFGLKHTCLNKVTLKGFGLSSSCM